MRPSFHFGDPLKTAFHIFGLAIALCMFMQGTAQACSLRTPANAQRAVPAGNLNRALLDEAVLAEINHARCRAGQRPVGKARRSLLRITEAHSKWMGQARRLSHRSNIRRRSTPAERVQASGIRPRRVTENIGYVNYYQLDGHRFLIVDAQTCQFTTSSGQPLPVNSYATLARNIVTSLMNSPGHRRNILDPQVSRVSTGAYYDPTGPHCGRIWFTQNFIN